MSRKKVSTPICYNCLKQLRPQFVIIRDKVPKVKSYNQKEYKIRIRGYGQDAKNYFCSLKCAFALAVELLNKNDSIKTERDGEVKQANDERGYESDGTSTLFGLLNIRNFMHDKNAMKKDKISWKKIGEQYEDLPLNI